MPRSFGNSYLVYNDEDVSILRKLVASHGPTVIVYPQSQAMKKVDENLSVFGMPVANLINENPTIANVVIDWFGTISERHGIKSGQDIRNASSANKVELSSVIKIIQQIKERDNCGVNAPGRWLIEAQVHSYKLYTQSFLSLIMSNGWVSDKIITAYFLALVNDQQLEEHIYIMDAAAVSSICSGTFYDKKVLTKLDISQYDKIIGAYNIGGMHWALLVLFVQYQQIVFIDPLGEKKAIISKLRKHWNYYAVHQYNAGHWNIKYQWEVVTKQHTFQGDSNSCGVYVMKFGEYYIFNKESFMSPLTEAIDVPTCRQEMAVKLLMSSSSLINSCRLCGSTPDSCSHWIQCDKCDKWFHTKCLEKSLKQKLDSTLLKEINYIGPCCSIDGNIVLC